MEESTKNNWAKYKFKQKSRVKEGEADQKINAIKGEI